MGYMERNRMIRTYSVGQWTWNWTKI
jgi:hypothetical protein